MSEMWSTLSPNIAYVALALVALGYALYRSALPKPLPGIPYSQTSSQRLLGDAPDMVEHMKVTGTVFDWWTAQGAKLQTPVYQLFLKPFSRPVVVVLDPKEAHDILYRRSKEFDRSRYIKGMYIRPWCSQDRYLSCLRMQGLPAFGTSHPPPDPRAELSEG